ncbi:uncharacterized protein BYT42DRAFT_484293, partial [Radiomyces spectabilis]|uniref:uncharacterized protein n=1 Tax=Radiomyces spectabilis TaxID=64574 RepID=UPI002220A38C
FYNRAQSEVIPVVIDYAGLTTDPDDLLLFVSHKNIAEIYVDRLLTVYKVERHSRQQLLED